MRFFLLFAIAAMALPAQAKQFDAVTTFNNGSAMTGSLRTAGPACVETNVSLHDPVSGWQHGTVESCWTEQTVGGEGGGLARKESGRKASINMPGMHTTFLLRGREQMRWGDDGDMHFAVATALDHLFSLGQEKVKPDQKLLLKQTWLGNEYLECASLDGNLYFCGKGATGYVRSIIVPGGEMQIAIDAIAQDRQASYVRKATVVYFGKPVARIEVTAIRRLNPSEIASEFAPPSGARTSSKEKAAALSGPLFRPSDLGATYDRMARAVLTVGVDGRATNVRVLAASNPEFADETKHALLRARYVPAEQGGLPVASVVSAAVRLPRTHQTGGPQLERDFYPGGSYLESWSYASSGIQ